MIILHLNSTEFLACLHYANTLLQRYGLNRVAFLSQLFLYSMHVLQQRKSTVYAQNSYLHIQ